MKTAYSSGGAGDIVFQIKIMRLLEVKTLYVLDNKYNEHVTIASTVGRLLRSQGIESFPILNPEVIKYDYDLDRFRDVNEFGHLLKRMLSQFSLPFTGWKDPWITGIEPHPNSYQILFNRTARHREESKVDWSKVVASIPAGKTLGFIGFFEEYGEFIKLLYNTDVVIDYIKTTNLFEVAQYIAGCEALYCNQSASLAIAQGMGHKYFLEHKPGKFNCLMNTKNENILT